MVHHRISSSTRFSTAFKLDAGLCLDIYIYMCFLYNDDLTYLRFDQYPKHDLLERNETNVSEFFFSRRAFVRAVPERRTTDTIRVFCVKEESSVAFDFVVFVRLSLSLSREAAALRIVRITRNDWKKRPRPKERIIKRDYTRTTRPSSSFFL